MHASSPSALRAKRRDDRGCGRLGTNAIAEEVAPPDDHATRPTIDGAPSSGPVTQRPTPVRRRPIGRRERRACRCARIPTRRRRERFSSVRRRTRINSRLSPSAGGSHGAASPSVTGGTTVRARSARECPRSARGGGLEAAQPVRASTEAPAPGANRRLGIPVARGDDRLRLPDRRRAATNARIIANCESPPPPCGSRMGCRGTE